MLQSVHLAPDTRRALPRAIRSVIPSIHKEEE